MALDYNIPKSAIPLSNALSPDYSFGGTTPTGISSPSTTAATAPSSTAPDTSGSSLAGALTAGAVGTYLGYQGNKQFSGMTDQLGKNAAAAGGAGQTYLNQALSGSLTPAQQANYNTLKQQSETVGAQAQPYLAAGAQGLQQYEAGQLPQWQQTQLDNQTAAALAQARASMGANVDSSTMAQIEAQIRGQAEIAKGQMLQNNLTTTQTLAEFGITQQKEAFALMDAANASVTESLQQDFKNALDALQISDSAIQTQIQGKIQANAAVGSAASSLMGNLTKAYALSAAQGSNGNLQNALYKLGLASQSGDMSNYLKTFNSETAGPGDTAILPINYLDAPAPTIDTPTVDVGNIDVNTVAPDINFGG